MQKSMKTRLRQAQRHARGKWAMHPGLADAEVRRLNCKRELTTLAVGTASESVLSRPRADPAGAKKEFAVSLQKWHPLVRPAARAGSEGPCN